MSKKAWIIFAAVCLVLLGGLIYLSNKEKVDVSAVDTHKIQPASKASGEIADHVTGNANSKVLLIEYGDYQCPGCGSAYPVIKSLTDKYSKQIGFVFRNFPLTQLHPNAKVAAAVAEAAGLQGKYWQMHDMLYTNQSDWENLTADTRSKFFVGYAKSLGLDTTKFSAAIGSDAVLSKISFDQALGAKDNVTGTPTFFLNGKQLTQYVKDGKLVSAGTDGAQPVWADATALETLVINPALKDAGIALPAANTNQ